MRNFFAAVFAAALHMASAHAQVPVNDTVMVFDASGSMWGRIDGRPKIEIAREAAGALVEALPRGARLGVVAYGHRRAGDCSDIATVLPVGPLDRARLGAVLAGITPRGKTPITEALREAAKTLDAERKGGTIILVTDGIETCKGDPCALAAELKRKNVNFVAHVVSFDVGAKGDRAKLACIAERTGGSFVPADNAGQLADALRRTAQAKAKPAAQVRRIALKATDSGRPVSGATFSVARASDKSLVAEGVSDAIDLAPARYVVTANAGVKTGTATADVTERAPTEIVVALSGTLPKASVWPLKPSAVATTEVEIAWQGPNQEGDFIAIVPQNGAESEERGYALTRNGSPARLRVPGDPGTYEVRYMLAQPSAILSRAPLNVTPATATLTAPQTASAGALLDVRWTAPGSEGDYISIASPPAADGEYVTYAYVREAGAAVSIQVPGTPGKYELRYVTGHESKVLARRPITITAAAATLSAAPTAAAGATIEVKWTGPGGERDYVSVAKPSAAPEGYVNFAYTREPTVQIQLPGEAGTFELRYVQAAPEGDKILARRPISVTAAAAAVSGPAVVKAGHPFSVTWSGPGGERDYVSLATPAAVATEYITYAYTVAPSPLLRAPAKAGDYELRYIQTAPEGDKVLVRSRLKVEPYQAKLEAPSHARRGTEVAIRFEGPAGEGDYIAVALPGAADNAYEAFVYISAGGVARLALPDQAGAFELRYVAALPEGEVVMARRPFRID